MATLVKVVGVMLFMEIGAVSRAVAGDRSVDSQISLVTQLERHYAYR